jgi:dolichol kinase
MGCAFPLCATFILIGGGVFPDNWVVWSLAGIIFLGLGDSAASIFGKNFGTTKWR